MSPMSQAVTHDSHRLRSKFNRHAKHALQNLLSHPSSRLGTHPPAADSTCGPGEVKLRGTERAPLGPCFAEQGAELASEGIQIAKRLGLESACHAAGRPRKPCHAQSLAVRQVAKFD